MIELRGHHLICRLGFRGLGYNEDFVKKMTDIVQQLQSSPELQIKVIDTPDVLCNHCPHLIDGLCQASGSILSEKKIKEMDRTVINILELKSEESYTVKMINGKLKSLFKEDSFNLVCGDCQWHDLGYCEDGLKNL